MLWTKPNLVKDFHPRLPLDLCFVLGQAFQYLRVPRDALSGPMYTFPLLGQGAINFKNPGKTRGS